MFAQKRNAKAADILKSFHEKQLAAVAGGVCRTCGVMVWIGKLLDRKLRVALEARVRRRAFVAGMLDSRTT